ncbi:MAG: hypothetical protein M3Q87_01585 [Actinomycetota bacterium]|nr:hypothetical protein [Actinomycetota bacterium]
MRAPRRTGLVVVAFTLLVALTVILGFARGGNGDEPPPSPTLTPTTQPQPNERPALRAFEGDSWWNTPVPYDAPLDPYGADILEFLSTGEESGDGCLKLAGAGSSPWGQPFYWSTLSDPTYDIQGIQSPERPPELDQLRIPSDASPGDNNDGNISIFDVDKGYVVALTDASYDESNNEWSASGGSVTYLDSNGLYARTGESDDPRNTGTHRGNNGAVLAARWDMVEAGAINHVLKVAVGPEVSERFVFPMVGSDGDYSGDDPAVPPQGLRLRIKPAVDLDELNLHPQALVIAETLQRYGFYIGDSGGTTALKLENTEAEGRGQLWQLTSDDLCGLPFTPEYWDVIAEGYDPSGL